MGARPAESTTAADLVHAARTSRGMSQRELAAAAGVPQSTVSSVESGQRQPSVHMLERLLAAAGFGLEAKLINNVRPSELLDRRRREVSETLARYPVTRVWLFGSVARGDDQPGSDLDLLVELEPGATFVDYVDLEDELSAVLGCRVDVVTTKELESNDLFRRRVHRQRREFLPAAA